MMRIVATLLTLSVWPTATYAFDLDQTAAQVRQARGVIVLGDLNVGEKATVGAVFLCEKSGRLFMPDNTRVQTDRSEASINWVATVKPGRKIQLQVSQPAGKIEQDVTNEIADYLVFMTGRTCEDKSPAAENLFEVLDINGYKNSSSITAKATSK